MSSWLASAWLSSPWTGSPWLGSCWGWRVSADALVFEALTFDPVTYEMLGVKTGTGVLSNGRNSGRYALNDEDLYYSVAAYEAAWNGGRNVQNLLSYSEDFSRSIWATSTTLTMTPGVSDPNGGTTAWTATATGASQNLIHTTITTGIAGLDYTTSIYLRRRTGTGTIKVLDSDSVATTVTLTGSWQRFSVTGEEAGSNLSCIPLRIVISGDAVDVWHPQVEQSSVPSEYCPTDTAEGDEFIENGWTGSASIVQNDQEFTFTNAVIGHVLTAPAGTTSIGLIYYYSITVSGLQGSEIIRLMDENNTVRICSSDGTYNGTYIAAYDQPRLKVYNENVDSTIVTLSIKRATTGYKVFANENGNTVASNVVTEGVGAALAEIPWLSQSPAATNSIEDSRDLTGWNFSGSPVVTLDQVGIDGKPNSATKVEDDSAGAYEFLNNNSLAATNAVECSVVAWIKKSGTAIAAIQINSTSIFVGQIDPSNGNVDWESSFIGNHIYSESAGDYWKLVISYTSDKTSVIPYIHPARTSILGTAASAAETGWNVFDCVMYLDDTPFEVARDLPPIFTEGAAVSVTADIYTLDLANHDNTRAGWFFELKPSYATAEVSGDLEILSPATAAGLSYYDGTNGDAESTDGTNTVTKALTLVAGVSYKIGIAYDAVTNELGICVDGAAWVEGTYDDAFTLGTVLSLFRAAANSNEMRNLRRYDLAYDAAKDQIDALMAVSVYQSGYLI